MLQYEIKFLTLGDRFSHYLGETLIVSKLNRLPEYAVNVQHILGCVQKEMCRGQVLEVTIAVLEKSRTLPYSIATTDNNDRHCYREFFAYKMLGEPFTEDLLLFGNSFPESHYPQLDTFFRNTVQAVNDRHEALSRFAMAVFGR